MAGVTNSSFTSIDGYSQQMLTQMGIHPINPTGFLGRLTDMMAVLYQDIVVFEIQYGVMFLVIGALVWYIAYKVGSSTVSMWAKRVVWGTFAAEAIIILLPQVYFGVLKLFSTI